MDRKAHVLRIVHISDIHRAPAKVVPVLRAKLETLRSSGLRVMAERLLQDLSWASRQALLALDYALKELFEAPVEAPTALVCTGDLSSFGDEESLSATAGWLDRVIERASLATPSGWLGPFAIPGNHDVHPGLADLPPLFAGAEELRARREHLTARYFGGADQDSQRMMARRLRGPGAVRVFHLDTVVEQPLANTLALGEVDGPDGTDPVGEILSQMQSNDVAVLLCHHPTLNQSPKDLQAAASGSPMPMRILVNAEDVLERLRQGRSRAAHPQIFLSGHRHVPRPAPSQLEAQGAMWAQARQFDLTVGTCAQDIREETLVRARQSGRDIGQWFQVLDFFDEDRDAMVLERTLWLREAGEEVFEPQAPERLRLDLS